MTKHFSHKQPYPLGAHVEDGGVRFSLVSRAETCGILLYDRRTGRLSEKIPFTRDDRIGNIYCRTVKGIHTEACTYLFYEDERLIPDERGRVFPIRIPYGKERRQEDMKAGFLTEEFDWGGRPRSADSLSPCPVLLPPCKGVYEARLIRRGAQGHFCRDQREDPLLKGDRRHHH